MISRLSFLAHLLSLALILLAGSASARNEAVAIDLLPGWRMENGNHMAGLRLRLAPGWKTYWRAPGEVGIPPRIDPAGSSNLKAIRVHWPTPQVFAQNGLTSVGYHDEVVLPLEVTPRRPGQPISLHLALDLGVCETICMPVAARLEGILPSAGQADPAIREALSRRPLSENEAGAGQVSCRVDPIADGVRLTASVTLPSLGAREYAVVEMPDPRIWVSQPEVSRQGGRLTVATEIVPPRGAPMALDRRALRLTILGEGSAVDIRGCD